mgnify:FL=1
MSTFFQQTAQAMIAKHIDRFPLMIEKGRLKTVFPFSDDLCPLLGLSRLRRFLFAYRQVQQRRDARQHRIGIPHPAVIVELINHDAADIRA